MSSQRMEGFAFVRLLQENHSAAFFLLSFFLPSCFLFLFLRVGKESRAVHGQIGIPLINWLLSQHCSATRVSPLPASFILLPGSSLPLCLSLPLSPSLPLFLLSLPHLPHCCWGTVAFKGHFRVTVPKARGCISLREVPKMVWTWDNLRITCRV